MPSRCATSCHRSLPAPQPCLITVETVCSVWCVGQLTCWSTFVPQRHPLASFSPAVVAAVPTQRYLGTCNIHVGRSARCTRDREGLLDLHRLHQVGRRRRQGHGRLQRHGSGAGREKGAAPRFTQCARCLRCRASIGLHHGLLVSGLGRALLPNPATSPRTPYGRAREAHTCTCEPYALRAS